MKNKDIITEKDFNAQVARRSSKSPQKDSPGDSGSDMNAEVDMGLGFESEHDEAFEEAPEIEDDIPAFDKSH